MEIKKVIKENGEYHCDIDVTIEEWKKVLLDKTIMNSNYVDVLLKFHSEPEHKSTCKALGSKFGKSPQSFNSTITNFAKAAQKKINRFEIIGTDGGSSFWIIPMIGKYRGKHFEWTIRPELVKAIEDVLINKNYFRFKTLLEYFVAHLEFCVTNDENNDRYNRYIKDIKNFNRSGQGHKGQKIQSQIKYWDSYPKGKICININSSGYKTRGCYLNWKETAINVNTIWENDSISKLKLVKDSYPISNSKDVLTYPIKDLGLFKDNCLNENLKFFFDKFNELISNFNEEQKNKVDMLELKPYLELLESNKNLILTGAPGTGKTYLAKQIAEKFGECEFVQFHPSFDYTDFVEGLRPIKKEGGELGFELRDGVFKEFCKRAIKSIISNEVDNFDDSWERLLSEIRNNLAKGKLTKIGSWEYDLSSKDSLKYSSLDTPSQYSFTITKKNVYDAYQNRKARPSGAFQKDMESVVDFMKKHHQLKDFQQGTAEQNSGKKFILIIDEINRAEISKVFGELFFSIDSGYRGVKGKVKTQYANLQDEGDVFSDGFYVPENVYIIGTMNDIDRSVESMDFAMRRRFAWKEITALERISMWNGIIDKWKEESEKRMINLNKAIEEIQGLSSAYHIGPAYFLKIEKYKDTGNPFEHLWENHLKGVIFEYLRGLPNSFELLENLKLSYNMNVDVEHI